MKFEIHELGNTPGLLHIHMEEKKLSWDFPCGSTYELCAVFDAKNGKNLRELQLAGVRPFLFHKQLRTSCRFCAEAYKEGFLLFPARIKDGVLEIGNQLQGQNALLSKKSAVIHVQIVMFKRRFLKETLRCVSSYTFREADVSETSAGENAAVYYRIISNNGFDDLVYRLPMTSDTLHIMVHANEKVHFFRDPLCTEPLEMR